MVYLISEEKTLSLISVFYSYAIISSNEVKLFMNSDLKFDDIDIIPYENFTKNLIK